MWRIFLLLYIALLPASSMRGDNFIPVISNYSSIDYRGGLQNWAITEGANGEMYFGNRVGVLRYDGQWWDRYPIPGNLLVRSLHYSRGRLYVGACEEFGYMERDAYGKMRYHSLWQTMRGYRPHSDEIWNIIETSDHRIIFQSFCSWFEYDGHRVTPHYNPHLLPLYFFASGHHIYVQLINGGFGRIVGGRYQPLFGMDQTGGSSVVAALPLSHGQMLLATEFDALRLYDGHTVKPYPTEVDAQLRRAQINRAIITPRDSILVVGTIHDGIYGIDRRGRLRWHYNTRNLLANNTVLRLFCDRYNNVWAALDAGLALIHTGAPYTLLTNSEQPLGMVYDVYATPTDLFIATNQITWRYGNNQRQMIQGTEGQNWHITSFGSQLIVGNNHGTKVIQGTTATPLPNSRESSSTALRRYVVSDAHDYLIESTYSDLHIYKNVAGRWVYLHNVAGFQAPVQQFEVDANGTLWAAHMSYGVYRLELSADMRRVVRRTFYPSLSPSEHRQSLHVVKVMGQVVFGDGRHLYTYAHGRFSRFRALEAIVPGKLVAVTYVDNRHFWATTDRGYALIAYHAGKFSQQMYIPATFFGLECSDNTNNVRVFGQQAYFCLNGGIGRMNMATRPQAPKGRLQLLSATDHRQGETSMPILPGQAEAHGDVTLRFSFPVFDHSTLRFRYVVSGCGINRTEESDHPLLRLSGMGYGTCTVRAAVIDTSGRQLSSLTYTFDRPRPLLLSIPMILLYVVAGLCLLWLFVRWRTQKVLRRQQRLMEAEKMRQDLKLAEQQRIIEDQNRQLLEQRLAEQGQEIASLTMSAVQSGDARDIDEYWRLFQENFDLIHKNFFRNLRTAYPSLTATDLKFCAYLRLNLSTKDIARFTGLTLRGVEGARHRLRKKLHLADGQSLTEFLIDFK